MIRIKKKKALLLVSVLAGFAMVVFMFQGLLAYDDKTTHPALTDEIVDFYNISFDNNLTPEEKEWIVQGAIDEDTPPRWINHFYDPIWEKGWSGEHTGWLWEGLVQDISYWILAQFEPVSSLNWLHNRSLQTSYSLYGGDHTWDRAVEEYRKGNKKEAYRTLGHVLHLIEDASVPDHTRNDTHAHEMQWATGDYGSPYEEYLKQYNRQTIKQLRIIEALWKDGRQSPQFATVDDYLISLAKYSNGYFFSKDTINNSDYQYPDINVIKKNCDKDFCYSNDESDISFPVVKGRQLWDSKTKQYNTVYDLLERPAYQPILNAYFTRLSRQTVLYGAGVIELFHKQANDSGAKINGTSWFALPVVSITGEVYRVKNFFSSVVSAVGDTFSFFSNFLSAQLSGLIFTSAQTQGQVVAQPLVQPTLSLPMALGPQSDTPATSPIAYEVPIMPTAQTANMQSDTPMAPAYQVAISLTEPPTATSTFSAITATITAPVFHGNGSVTGVSPDAVATLPPVEPPLTSSETSTTTDVAATSTDNTATSTEPVVVVTASPTPETVDGPPVVINEIAWMGTKAQANDEWIELYNKTNHDVDLSGWSLESRNKVFSVVLSKTISAHGYFLLERTASTTTDRAEDLIYKGALNDSGSEANIYLKNGTTTADYFDLGYWPFVNNKDTRHTLERVSPYATSTNSYNWKEYSEALTPPFAKDAGGGDIFGTPGRKNSVAGYYTPTGSITEDTVWRKAYSPYYVPPYMLQVQSGATLTIEPGVVVKFAKGALYGGGMDVRGMLRAEGTVVNPIVFTSFLDDTADGIDSNQDGSASVPASADWMNINFYGTSTPSVFSYVQVQYGGQGMNNSSSGWYPKYTGVFSVHGASPHITDSVFDKNHAISLYMEKGAHPIVARTAIKNTVVPTHTGAGPGGFGVRIADASSTADIIGNIFENNNIGISSESATSAPLIVKDNVFTRNQKNGEFNGGNDFNLDNTNNQDSENKGGFYIRLVVRDGQVKILKADVMPYIVENGITVQEGGVLAIEPGAVLKSKDLNNSGSFAVPFIIKGVLHAQGTTDHPIVFTAFEDDSDGYDSNNSVTLPAAGAWENIQFLGATSSGSVLEYVAVRYGGLGRTACNSWCIEYKGAVRIQDASPTISHATFDQNLAIAVFIEGAAQPIIEYSDIRNTKEAIKTPSTTIGGIGMSIGAGLMPTLIDNTFTNNLEDVVYRL